MSTPTAYKMAFMAKSTELSLEVWWRCSGGLYPAAVPHGHIQSARTSQFSPDGQIAFAELLSCSHSNTTV